jgi:hypothetical protein
MQVATEAATAPNFHHSKYRESVAEADGLKPLLDCDVILAAADDAFASQVLDHAAYAHLIPIVDGGTTLVANPNTLQLQAGKTQIVSAGPGHPCLECQGVYTQRRGDFVGVQCANAKKAARKAPGLVEAILILCPLELIYAGRTFARGAELRPEPGDQNKTPMNTLAKGCNWRVYITPKLS